MGEETDIAEPMSSEDVVAAENVTADEPSKDQRRKRKKHLYKSLQDLMEFYLGDANLSKDRFMAQRIQGQAFVYVDLSMFLTFNKVKTLTSSIEDLAQALSPSEILQVSEDGQRVCRKTPIRKKDDEDECTIYVEQLGPDMDHDFLIKVFSEFGPVDYVSLPRFPHNGKFKGFGFVEFKDVQSAKNALEVFNARGCCLSPHMAPEELMSIKNFDPNKENKKAENLPGNECDTELNKNDIESSCEGEDNKDDTKIHLESEKNKIIEVDRKNHLKKEKRKRKFSEGNEQMSHKKLRLQEHEDDQPESYKRNKANKEEVNTAKDVDNDTIKEKHQEPKKKNDKESTNEITNRRSRNKKKDKSNMHEKTRSEQPEVEENKDIVKDKDKSQRKKQRGRYSADEVVDKNILTKSDEEISEPATKKHKLDTEDGTETEVSQPEEDAGDGEMVKHKKKRKRRKRVKKDKSSAFSLGLKVLPKREWKQLRNKYLNMQRDMMRSLKQHLSYSKWEKNKPEMEERTTKQEDMTKSGTVVKVILDEPITSVKTAKSEMRIHPDIRYVDATEGSPCVYLRTSAPELATSLVQSKHWSTMEVIQGSEETEYWNKMKMDREEHFKKSKPNQRGRTKLLKRAEKFQDKHITAFEST